MIERIPENGINSRWSTKMSSMAISLYDAGHTYLQIAEVFSDIFPFKRVSVREVELHIYNILNDKSRQPGSYCTPEEEILVMCLAERKFELLQIAEILLKELKSTRTPSSIRGRLSELKRRYNSYTPKVYEEEEFYAE